MRKKLWAEVCWAVTTSRVIALSGHLAAQHGVCLSLGPVGTLPEDLHQRGGQAGGEDGVAETVELAEHVRQDGGGRHPDARDLVLHQLGGHGRQVLSDVAGREERHQDQLAQLLRQLQSEPPVPLIVHLQELLQSW